MLIDWQPLIRRRCSLDDLFCEAKSYAIGFFWLGMGGGFLCWLIWGVAYVVTAQ